MPPEVEWVRTWLTKAKRDLSAARRLIAEPPILAEIACFHAQQAAEKSLKGFLVYHEVEFEKVHAIRYLLDLCIGIDDEFERLRERAEPLTRYAILGRYPAPGAEVTQAEATAAVEVAAGVSEFVLSRLPQQVRPAGD